MPCVCKTTLIEQKKALQKTIAQIEDACATLDSLIEQTCDDHDDSEANNDHNDVLVHTHSDELKHTEEREAAEKKHREQEDIKLEAVVRMETTFWTREFDEVNKSSDINQRDPQIDILDAPDIPKDFREDWKLGAYQVHALGGTQQQLSWQQHNKTSKTHADLHRALFAAKGIRGNADDCFLLLRAFSHFHFQANTGATFPKKWTAATIRFQRTKTECEALVFMHTDGSWLSASFILNPRHEPDWYKFALPL